MKKLKDITISPIEWAAYAIMPMLVELLQLNTRNWWEPVVSCVFNLFFYGVISWMLCGLTCFSHALRKPLCLFFHAVMALYALSSVFLFFFFGRHWDATTFQFLFETNRTEAGEFASTFLFSWPFLLMLLSFALFFLLENRLYRRVHTVKFIPRRRAGKTMMACSFALAASQLVFFTPDAGRNYDWAGKAHSPIKRNALWNLWQSCCQFDEYKEEFEQCAAVQRQYHEAATCRERSADVVLVIGESFNRHTSNLYDGKYPTNPLLLHRVHTGRLVLFTDVIASHNGTTQNFKYFLSAASVGEKKRWCDVPLFPAILKRCGYNVVFYSNQLVPNDNLGQWDASMGFMNHPGVSPYFQNHRNARKYAYDMQLVDDYEKHRGELETAGRNFIMFHLYGQHINASQRYPVSFTRFKASDVDSIRPWRNKLPASLSREARQQVADYLNATYYNDHVVDHIIHLFENKNALIVYFSDHGEEVNNFRAQYGRTDLQNDVRKAMQCQLDVPFMVYMTETYEKTHPEVAARLRAARSKRFMTDGLPQLLFDVLGVNTRYFVPKLSPLNDTYDTSRKRLTQYGRYYDL